MRRIQQPSFCLSRRQLLALPLAAALVPASVAAAAENLYWTPSVRFVGPPADWRTQFPSTSLLLQDGTHEQALVQRLRDAAVAVLADRTDLRFLPETVAAQGDDHHVLSFALDGEEVESQWVDGRLAVSYELQALVLLLNLSRDPNRQRVVGSYPVRVRYLDMPASGQPPSPDQRLAVFRQMLLEPAIGMPSLVHEWARQAAKLSMRNRDKFVRVKTLQLTDAARQSLANAGAKATDVNALAQRATSMLEAGLVKAFNIPIIPDSGELAAGVLLLTTANGTVGPSFAFAAPDHSLELTLRDVRHLRQPGSGGRVGEAFGAAFAARYLKEEPDGTSKPLLQASLRRVDMVFHMGDRQLQPAPQFSRVVANFSHELTQNLAAPNLEWLTLSKSDAEAQSPSDLQRAFQSVSKSLR